MALALLFAVCVENLTANGWKEIHYGKSKTAGENSVIGLEGLEELRTSCPPGTRLQGPAGPDGEMVTVNGRVEAACARPDGSRHGPALIWNAAGGKASSGEYRDGVKEGLWSYWHENGRMSGRGVFRGGKPEGAWVTWHDNGTKESEGSYVEGMRHGRFIHWDRGGAIIQEVHYDNGGVVERVSYRNGKPLT